eukprot:5873362-Pyramimonas_sp.AAC.1
MVAPPNSDEGRRELEWASGRGKSLARGRSVEELFKLQNPFESALTEPELKILGDYEKQGEPNQCCSLNQRPANNRGMQSSGPVLYTIIRNPSIDFNTSSQFRRWLFPTELMIAQGLPILSWMASPTGASSTIATSYSVGSMLVRNRQSVKYQIGNTMQVMVVGSVMTYAFFFTNWGAQ